MLRILFIILIISISINKLTAQCPEPVHPDYDALMALYNATDGLNWNINEGWLQGSQATNCDPCTWFEIDCNLLGRVETIRLYNNNLVGTIPAEIGELSELLNLELGLNNLQGELPPEIGQLEKLEDFGISQNNIEGTIPESFLSLNNLEFFTIAFNNLSGNFPKELFELPNIFQIYASNNFFEGEIPLFEVTSDYATYLGLSGNKLTGTIPPEIYSSGFKNIDLSQNKFTGPLEILDENAAVEELNISGNQLNGNIPAILFQLPSLKDLDLSFNQFTGTIEYEESIKIELDNLNLSNNFLDGTILNNVQGYFQFLDLSNNKLSGQIPAYLYGYSLILRNNNFSGCYPRAFTESNCFDFQTIDLTGNPLLPWGGDFELNCTTFEIRDQQISAPCGDNLESRIQVDCTCQNGNVELLKLDELFNVYPNPCTNNLKIEPKTDFQIRLIFEIYNSIGKKVDTKQLITSDESYTLNTSSWEVGVYFLAANDGNGTVYQKVTKL